MLLLGTLDKNLPTTEDPAADLAQTRPHGQSYAAAVETLGRAGIVVRPDGLNRYVAERRKWEPLVSRVAKTLGFVMDEIDRGRLEDKAAGSEVGVADEG